MTLFNTGIPNNGYFNNINLLEEDNFSIVPPNTLIWEGELPFKENDVFPTPFIQERANIIKTNESLYKSERFQDIFSTLFNFNDFMVDAITNMQILRLIPYLPDFRSITDIWVDLISAKAPKIEGSDEKKVGDVATLVGSSNFAPTFQELVKHSLFMFGNAVCRVDRQIGGNARVVLMPLKTWIPFVSETDATSIDVNCFFNIYPIDKSNHYCEFILYHEGGDDAGKIEKYTFEYHKSGRKLGKLIDHVEDEAFDGAGVSPIVVFTGQKMGNTVYGEGQYRKWEPSITSSMRAYETILVLLERTKEINRVMPEGATFRDESTGVTYSRQTGSMQYDIEDKRNAQDYVHYATPEIKMKEANEAYKETLTRVSRDTDLSYTMFDTKELGSQMSGKALKTAMYRTELRAKSLSTLINNSAKQLVVKLALASGVEIDQSDFSLITESGFVHDEETLVEMINSRLGNQVSLTLADAIARMDDVPLGEARRRANEILGIEPEETEETELTDTGDESVVAEVQLTNVSESDDKVISGVNSKEQIYLLSDGDIDHNPHHRG